MKFEVGKCYRHKTGEEFRIIAEVDTYHFGKCLIGESSDTATYVPFGMEENNSMDWEECEDFAKYVNNNIAKINGKPDIDVIAGEIVTKILCKTIVKYYGTRISNDEKKELESYVAEKLEAIIRNVEERYDQYRL